MATCVIVLAQGRTGTTAVARVLKELGIFMGKHLSQHCEATDFYQLHQKMIPDWKNPRPCIDTDIHRRYIALINQRNKHKIWGIKDPRLCFLFPLLVFGILDQDVRVIYTTRPRQHVIASLSRYPGVNPGEAKDIYNRYHAGLKKVMALVPDHWPKITIDYDSLVEDPRQQVERIASFVGLPVKDSAVQILDSRRRHHK